MGVTDDAGRTGTGMGPEKIFTGYFICVLTYSFISQLTMQMTNYVLPLFVVNALQSKATMSGVLAAVFAAGSMACRFTTGGLTDRFGRRRMMILGMGIVTLAMFTFGATQLVSVIVLMKFVQGVGHSINTTASNSAASDVLPKSKLGEGIGYYGLTSTIVGAFGPMFCLAMMRSKMLNPWGFDFNYSLPMTVGGGLGLVAVLLAFSLVYEKKWGLSFSQAAKKKFSIHDYIEVRSLVPAVLQFFQSIATGAGMFLVLYMTDRGLFDFMSKYYFVMATVVTVVTRMTLGKMADRMKPRFVIFSMVCLQAVAYLVLAAYPGKPALIATGIVSGVFSAMIQPTLNALALKSAPTARAGAASATYWLGFDAGMAVGPTVFGMVVDAAGYSNSFVVGAVCMAVFAAVVLVVLRRTPAMRDIVQPTS
ncbi:MAG: MFS transporter [Lachnospiraceae bacterium]|nr:MFS transporter [Lachnospiraceae bacterium]